MTTKRFRLNQSSSTAGSDCQKEVGNMGVNHVRMDGHIYAKLNSLYEPQVVKTPTAYGTLWQYVLFIGQKK